MIGTPRYEATGKVPWAVVGVTVVRGGLVLWKRGSVGGGVGRVGVVHRNYEGSAVWWVPALV